MPGVGDLRARIVGGLPRRVSHALARCGRPSEYLDAWQCDFYLRTREGINFAALEMIFNLTRAEY